MPRDKPHPLLQQGPPDGHPLLQFFDLSLMLCLRVNLDLALIGVQKFQLFLKLNPQLLVLCLLCFVQPQLAKKYNSVTF